MSRKKVLISLAIVLITSLAVFSILPKSNINKVGGKFVNTVEILKNGEVIWKSSNLIVDNGFQFIRNQLLTPSSTYSLVYIAVTNQTGVCTSTATSIPDLTVNGLSRAQGTYTTYGNNQYVVEKTYTITGDVINVQVAGLYYNATGNTLFACAQFPIINLQANDQLTVRWNITVIEAS